MQHENLAENFAITGNGNNNNNLSLLFLASSLIYIFHLPVRTSYNSKRAFTISGLRFDGIADTICELSVFFLINPLVNKPVTRI